MADMAVRLEAVAVEKPEDVNVIVGQAHFIKTVEDLHETLAGVSPHLRFGIAFCEASAARLVRRSGNDAELTGLAASNAQAIAAGHAFVIMLREGFPVNVHESGQAGAGGLHRLLRHRQPGRRARGGQRAWPGIAGVIDGRRRSGSRQTLMWRTVIACSVTSATSCDHGLCGLMLGGLPFREPPGGG